MVSITDLYRNVKELVLQYFSSKEYDDRVLHNEIHDFFHYTNGVVSVSDNLNYVDNFENWTGSQPVYSDFILPTNHMIRIIFKDTPNIQVACSDTSNNWIYAQNIGYSNNGQFSYRTNNNSVRTMTYTFTRSIDSVYKIICIDEMISFYVDDTLIHQTQTYDPLTINRHIRIYDNPMNIEYMEVSSL